eukprot:gene6586-7090_t
MNFSETDIIRLIIGEVLNENHEGLQSLIHEYITKRKVITINVIGYCGESPGHIAIYKNDEKMLEIIIAAGADPNFKNSQGETLLHIATKLGRIRLLQLLYETGQANLEIEDDQHHLTPLQYVKNLSYNEEIMIATQLYQNWKNEDIDESDSIKQGREECRLYLEEKMEYDKQMKIINLTKQVTDWTIDREKKRRILCGLDDENTIGTLGPYIDYPREEGKCTFDEYDQRFFNHYRKGIHYLATKSFSDQISLNGLKIGALNAKRTLTNQGTKK